MLHLGNETTKPLSPLDSGCGLFLLDSTWNYEAIMHTTLKQNHTLVYRSLPPGFVTAYPRKQTKCIKPEEGLSTLEALYIAYTILGRDTSTLLESYYWKNLFLQKNTHQLSLLTSL